MAHLMVSTILLGGGGGGGGGARSTWGDGTMEGDQYATDMHVDMLHEQWTQIMTLQLTRVCSCQTNALQIKGV